MKYVNENADENILYPGHHENWFTAALPPWLPRKAGMAVIKAAKTKLVERVKEYLKSGTPLPVAIFSHFTAGFQLWPFHLPT